MHEWGGGREGGRVDILAFGTGVKDSLAFISRPCLLCAVGHLFMTTLGATPLHLDNRGGRKKHVIACMLSYSSDTGMSLYGAHLGLLQWGSHLHVP